MWTTEGVVDSVINQWIPPPLASLTAPLCDVRSDVLCIEKSQDTRAARATHTLSPHARVHPYTFHILLQAGEGGTGWAHWAEEFPVTFRKWRCSDLGLSLAPPPPGRGYRRAVSARLPPRATTSESLALLTLSGYGSSPRCWPWEPTE